jgi:hypothetical protein
MGQWTDGASGTVTYMFETILAFAWTEVSHSPTVGILSSPIFEAGTSQYSKTFLWPVKILHFSSHYWANGLRATSSLQVRPQGEGKSGGSGGVIYLDWSPRLSRKHGRATALAVGRRLPGFDQVMWVLWWTSRHWGQASSEYLFPLSILLPKKFSKFIYHPGLL